MILSFTLVSDVEREDDDLCIDSDRIESIVNDRLKDGTKIAVIRCLTGCRFIVYDDERTVQRTWKEAVDGY